MANRALLVGINAYPASPLRGCLADCQDVADLITSDRYGFNVDDVRIVVDARATTAAIYDRLAWLVQDARPGDRLLFHYSGHGTMLPVRNAAGTITSLHACICPVDFDWTPERAIIDDDFMRLFADVPKGVRLFWTSDSCHSGSLARAMHNPDRIPRTFPVPPDMAWGIKTAAALLLKPLPLSRSIERLNGAFISGCATDQTAADAAIEGRYCGAFTHYLIEELDDAIMRTSPVAELVAGVHAELHGAGYAQNPQLVGEAGLLAKPWLAR